MPLDPGGPRPSPEPPREQRPLFDQLLHYGFYAPLGAAVHLAEDLPTLLDKGRSRLGSQVTMARMVGRFAVGTARRRVGETLEPAVAPIVALVRQVLDTNDDESAPTEPDGDAGAGSGAAAGPQPPSRTGGNEGPTVSPPLRTAAGSAPGHRDGSSLPIPGYDSLAASQVVPRLEALGDAELAEVRSYEEQTRRRRTILGRIAQLEAGGSHHAEA